MNPQPEPSQAPRLDRLICANDDCRAVLAERNRDGVMMLTYWERHIPRQHPLRTVEDIPQRPWKCSACGTMTTLDASIL